MGFTQRPAALRAECKVYLLLRSGEPLLDVDGQFPGGDPFPCLGHVALRGGLPGGVQDQRRRRRDVAEGETLPWCVKPPRRATNSNPGHSFLKVQCVI